MKQWLTQSRRTGTMAALVMTLAGAVTPVWGAGAPPPPDQYFYVLLVGGLQLQPATVDLNVELKGEDTVTVTAPFNLAGFSTGFETNFIVGQRFDSAELQLFNQNFVLRRTYQLSPAKVTAVRLSGGSAPNMTIVFSGKTVVVP
jgi:hypothetical protein